MTPPQPHIIITPSLSPSPAVGRGKLAKKMPHRVANFFRSSATTIENQVSTLTKTARRRDSPGRERQRSSRSGRSSPVAATAAAVISEPAPSYASSVDTSSDSDDSQLQRMRMGDTWLGSGISSDTPREQPHHHHRLSFPSMHFGRSFSKENHTCSLASLDWKLESPPIVLYGDAESSTGALISGQVLLNIKEDLLEIDSVNATLCVRVTQKKPFTHHCHECANQVTELKRWSFLQHPLALTKGEHTFPFSVLLEGHLPASQDGPLTAITYEFRVEALSRANGAAQPPIRLEKFLEVKRSLPASETPHHSIRVFPPTNIKANVHYPHVIHPTGSNKLTIRLDGIAKHNVKVKTMEYWKLKKLTWKLEETIKTVAPACEKHTPKATDAEQQPKKGIARTETRVIGEKQLFSGWKSNYASTTDSCIEVELDYFLSKHAKAICDTKSRDGTEVTHQLMVEMVVSQEWAPIGKPALVTHTGVGRILRMHFSSILTERGGIGISWDNEAPPIYQDVPPSPPAYSQVFTHNGVECSIDEMIEPLDGVTAGDSQSQVSTESTSAAEGHERSSEEDR